MEDELEHPGLSFPIDARGDTGEATILNILRAADLMTRIGDSKVFGRELTQAQFNILMILKRHGQNGMSQKEIAAYLVTTKGNISIHTGNLARTGYIRRRVCRSDGRMHRITLTEKGAKILARLEPAYLEHVRKVTDGLPRKQAESTVRFIARLVERCSSILNGGD